VRFSALLVGVLAVASLAGCRSAPKEATDAELAPVDQDANAPVPRLMNDPEPVDPSQPAGAATAGPIVTLIYVTEIGNREKHRPGAVIFSSDPECPYFANERPRPSRVMVPTTGSNMLRILNDLQKAGLGATATADQRLEDPITRDRQVIVIRDGKRVCYTQGEGNAFQAQAFTRCQNVLIGYSRVSTYVETEGLHPGDKSAPEKH
jgi:hypothetical protein